MVVKTYYKQMTRIIKFLQNIIRQMKINFIQLQIIIKIKLYHKVKKRKYQILQIFFIFSKINLFFYVILTNFDFIFMIKNYLLVYRIMLKKNLKYKNKN